MCIKETLNIMSTTTDKVGYEIRVNESDPAVARIDLPNLSALDAIIYYEIEIKSKYASFTMFTKEGEITMLYDKTVQTDELVLYRIFLLDEYQRKGILTNIVRHFQQDPTYGKIVICAAEGPTEYCLRKINYLGQCFVNVGGDFVWKRNLSPEN